MKNECESCHKSYYEQGHWAGWRLCPSCSASSLAGLKREIDRENYETWKRLARDNPNEMPGGVNFKPSWLKYQARYEEEILLRNFGAEQPPDALN
jgi:hypothetical protein